ncbi:dihydroxyacetone kinase phosphoryl donor subunit DhaM [Nocardiopsis suaedae]|uniref:phosphoenolpyruvate--glycerone phosphotransferase n=1 Tax=Nocardiopsis suaedae TaxID=3018444 RepID=A0ABT4TGB0_9ACTN|nr:dihydroxyacetone kinase phosphoryl donor subunit DhaM [Nocardiopsis suaedae]MDA2803626.1 dihydroxyacetone kinase phosphoryl donor subunit DhaM [Nocardiopsis suaedae]
MGATVGIVLVSHSERLAAGVKELLEQLGARPETVAAAGGDPDGGIGTSYERIAEAVAGVDQGAGVMVLPDIGSAVMTARLVFEDEPRDDAVVVDAPFVEGAVAAGVLASTGASLDAVVAAARDAYTARKIQE